MRNTGLVFLSMLLFQCKAETSKKTTAEQPVHEQSKKTDSMPAEVTSLLKYYPQIQKFENNTLYFKDGTTMVYDDGKKKTTEELLNSPDIQDQFEYKYKKGPIPKKIDRYDDPGRIRNEAFFKKIYGSSEGDVRKNLVEIVWCPKLVNQKISVTKVNGVDKAIKQISAELDEMPEFKDYIKNIGGTFMWRYISGTTRLSTHSFGTTMDINTKYSDYWQWDCNCKNEAAVLGYKNKIPQKIVDVFERNGFIWGGKWYHFDSMHFEYRPELMD